MEMIFPGVSQLFQRNVIVPGDEDAHENQELFVVFYICRAWSEVKEGAGEAGDCIGHCSAKLRVSTVLRVIDSEVHAIAALLFIDHRTVVI